jgi:hypothetical protein
MDQSFDPRRAALHYAAEAERRNRPATHVTGKQFGEAVEAVVCALIYVGDQLAPRSADDE